MVLLGVLNQQPLSGESPHERRLAVAAPALREVPIGLPPDGTCPEFDSMGTVKVPASMYAATFDRLAGPLQMVGTGVGGA
jgi:hypothetical protein